MYNETLLERLQKLLTHKKSKKFYAEKLGISEQDVQDLLSELRKENRESIEDQAEAAAYIAELEENLEKGELKSILTLDFNPKSVEELYELHKIDKAKYKIVNYWSKLKSNGKFTSSVFATAKKASNYTPEDFAAFLQDYQAPPIQGFAINIVSEDRKDVDVELSIADFHLAKKTLEVESIADRKKRYLTMATNLVLQVHKVYNIRKLVFVIGNDFFHTDNYQGTTTNGTPQDFIAEYDAEYEDGFDLLVTTLLSIMPYTGAIEVILQQGNHDRTKSFYVAHALEVYFKMLDKDGTYITFQRHHSVTKSVVLGETFIGYHHGNCKIDSLPMIFATGKDSAAFGNAKYREIHTGDKHHYMAKEFNGVRIQQMPSLSGTDRWHIDNNFVHSIRAALILVYHPTLGKIAEFEERV